MLQFAFNWQWFIFELLTYFFIDNGTKYMLGRSRDDHRLTILTMECFLIGLIVGFLSYIYYVPWILVAFLCLHTFGMMYAYNTFSRFINRSKAIIQSITGVLVLLFRMFFKRRISKASESKQIPAQYLYNFHLKPTNDLRLQQSSTNKSLPRPGMLNFNGSTCSLNSLMQSLASLDSFCFSLKRNMNTSRFNYDSVVYTFTEILLKLRNEVLSPDVHQRQHLVDGSHLVSQLTSIYPNLLSNIMLTDICELFQSIIDILNQSLSKDQICTYSNSVVSQVQNTKFNTLSLEQLNKIFNETEVLLHETITLENLDAQTSLIFQYIDVTWLLHHIQLGSTIKQYFSGQILHAHCCSNCAHVRFRTEPFQILPITIPYNGSHSLQRLIAQFTKIDIATSMMCSFCSNMPTNDPSTPNRFSSNANLLSNISSTVSPIISNRRQASDQIFASTPISNTNIGLGQLPRSKPVSATFKSQMMIANLPEVLCLQLKRFAFDRRSQKTVKLTTSILVETEKMLDLSTIHFTTWLGLEPLSMSTQYRLSAVCLHLSQRSMNGIVSTVETRNGHWVSLYRSSQNRWFLCDDERITEITNVEHFFQTPYVTDNCYLLLYERC